MCPCCMEGGGAGVSLSGVKKRKRKDVTYCPWWWWCVVTGISMKGDGCRGVAIRHENKKSRSMRRTVAAGAGASPLSRGRGHGDVDGCGRAEKSTIKH